MISYKFYTVPKTELPLVKYIWTPHISNGMFVFQIIYFMKHTNTLFRSLFSGNAGLKKMLLAGAFFAATNANAQPAFMPCLTHQYCLDGNANDGVGTLHGTVMGATPTTDRWGNLNMAYQFNGISDFIDLPDDIWVDGDFSVAGWVLADAPGAGSWSRMFEFGNGVDQQNVFFTPSMGGSNQPALGLHDCSTTARDYAVAPAVVAPGAWHHYAVVLQGNIVTVYLDNSVWYTFTTSYPPCGVTRTENYFGKSNFSWDAFFRGKLDDIFIFNCAITPTDVNTLYNVQWCPSITGPVNPFKAPENNNNGSKAYKGGLLKQNTPNPFNGETSIAYEIPAKTKSASLEVVDITGRVIREYNLNATAAGKVKFQGNELIPGIYTYVLKADGTVVDQKKMIIAAE